MQLTEKGKTKDFTVTVVDEDHIEIEGNDKIAIPLDGEVMNSIHILQQLSVQTDRK